MTDKPVIVTQADERACLNTDVVLWREIENDYYAPSIHRTSIGAIGINVSGTVYVKTLRDWHELAGGRITGLSEDRTAHAPSQPDCVECSGTGVAEKIGGYERPCDACFGEGFVAAAMPSQHSELADIENLLLYHESGGHEGDGSDEALRKARLALSALRQSPQDTVQREVWTALQMQQEAEMARNACEECEGEGDWIECSICSLSFGWAIDARHEALGIKG